MLERGKDVDCYDCSPIARLAHHSDHSVPFRDNHQRAVPRQTLSQLGLQSRNEARIPQFELVLGKLVGTIRVVGLGKFSGLQCFVQLLLLYTSRLLTRF